MQDYNSLHTNTSCAKQKQLHLNLAEWITPKSTRMSHFFVLLLFNYGGIEPNFLQISHTSP